MKRARDEVVTGLATMAVLAAFIGWVVMPVESRLRSVSAETHRMRAVMESRSQMAFGPSAVEAELGRLRAEEAVVRKAIPWAPSLGRFLEALSEVCANAQLSATDVTPLAEYSVGPIGVLPILVSFESGFAGVFTFLQRIETLERVVWVSRIETSRVADRSNRLSTSVLMHVFHEPTERH